MDNKERPFPFSVYKLSGEGRIINTHSHKKSLEIVEVTSGELSVQIGTDRAVAERGDFLFVPQGRMFRADALTPTASVRGVVFESSLLKTNMQRFDSEVFYMFDVQSKNKIARFGVGHEIHPCLMRYMQDAYDEYMTKDVCYNLPVCAYINLLMTSLLRYYCGSRDELDRMVYHNVLRLRPVVSYIEEHFVEKIYVEKLSDMINVSPDYFTKMFKDSMGKTPIEYINGMRVNLAVELLSTTELSMSEIAEKTGFCNPNYFNKIFKQYMDISPLAYRKSCK